MSVTYPAPLEPIGIDAAGKGALVFVPAIANPAVGPTVAEIAAGVNLSCALYAWNPAGSQSTVERSRYCSRVISESLGKATYKADPIQYDYDPQDPESDEYPAYAALIPDTKGYLVDRRGLDYATAMAAAQIVDIYPVQMGVRSRVAIDVKQEGDKLRVEQAVAITGEPFFDVKVVA